MTIVKSLRFTTFVAICVIGTACGGGSDETTPTGGTSGPTRSEVLAGTTQPATEAPAPPSTAPAATAPAATAPAATAPAATAPAATAPATTAPPATAPPTTAPPQPEPTGFDLATLPDLIALTDQATTDPTIAPLVLAQQWIGFPYEIPVPEGSTLFELSADPWFGEDGTRFTFTYDAIAPGGMVPDIDITLDDNGPGSIEITEIWDPIMTGLGFERKNSTGSDPGDPGGPNSVNHVYTTEMSAGIFDGVPGEVAPIFIWSTEDINGWSYSPEREELAGYSIDVDIDIAAEAGVPVPLVNAVLDQLPIPDGLELSDAGVDLRRRDSDSFDADRGLLYVDVSLEWQAPADRFDSIVAFYADPETVFADEAMLMAGEDDFFDNGTIERGEWYTYGEADQRLPILLLQRYEGTLGIDASPDGVEPATLALDLELNPVAPPLELPAG